MAAATKVAAGRGTGTSRIRRLFVSFFRRTSQAGPGMAVAVRAGIARLRLPAARIRDTWSGRPAHGAAQGIVSDQ